jgi:hypothetical protein
MWKKKCGRGVSFMKALSNILKRKLSPQSDTYGRGKMAQLTKKMLLRVAGEVFKAGKPFFQRAR